MFTPACELSEPGRSMLTRLNIIAPSFRTPGMVVQSPAQHSMHQPAVCCDSMRLGHSLGEAHLGRCQLACQPPVQCQCTLQKWGCQICRCWTGCGREDAHWHAADAPAAAAPAAAAQGLIIELWHSLPHCAAAVARLSQARRWAVHVVRGLVRHSVCQC